MKIGALVNNLGSSQLSYYIINNFNKVAGKGKVDPIVYCENVEKDCLFAKFPTMQLAEAWGQEGTMIATSLSTAKNLVSYPSPQKRLYYVWDLEWLRMPYDYNPLLELFSSDSIEIITRCENHARVVENTFNRKVNFIVDNFNIEQILDICKD
tara:strand:- start:1115 stop:1573 length:459 start_codon:yes stop_codon:yes gene_type:complete